MSASKRIGLLEHHARERGQRASSSERDGHRLPLRLRVWAGRRQLDQQLASGCEPAVSPECALRARQLEDPSTRRGVARALELITDGVGPLYNRGALRSLEAVLWSIADGLQPCPPHTWASPVVMKTDPEHVAWTCARCGEIAVTDGLTVKPA